jgi:tripartite motif-containing protein 23
VRQDDARVLLAAPELDTLLESVEGQQQQLAHLAPDQLSLDPAVPVTFTKDNRVHIGPKVTKPNLTNNLPFPSSASVTNFNENCSAQLI